MGSLWNRSGNIERDANDVRTNAKAFFFQGGTNVAFTVYQDAAQSIPHSNPVVANSGRWPAVFIPFTVSYDVRVLDQNDVQLSYITNIANPDPVQLSVTIPPEAQVQTGMCHWEPISGAKSGYVRLNSGTIGNAASGATERANADTVNLFTYLYNAMPDSVAPVSGGRGASAAADYAANKTIQLLDGRGGTLKGVDSMGAAAASRFQAEVPFLVGNKDQVGSSCGNNRHFLLTSELPVTSPTGSVSVSTPTGTVSTPTGSVSTPSGSVSGTVNGTGTNLNITMTDPGHVHTQNASTLYSIAGVGLGPGGTVIVATDAARTTVSNSTGVTGTLASNAIAANLTWSGSFSGNAATFTGNAQTFTGNAVSASFTGSPFGSGGGHNNTSYSLLGTWYQKL